MTYVEVAIVYGAVLLIGSGGIFLVACLIEKDARERARRQGRKRENWGSDW